MPQGTHGDIYINNDHFNEILNNGKYTILHIVERTDKDYEIVFGQIKK